MALIEIESLAVKYSGRKNPTLAHLSLSLRQGETVLFLGPSGCGKSTLALTLNGLIPHSVGAALSGRVIVDGLDTQQATAADLARKAGIVFQDPEAQFVTLKVEDEVVFGLENLCTPPEQMEAKVEAALAMVAMPAARLRPVHALSGGEKQRIALAALLVMAPHILVFDEPTANLDPIGTADVFNLIAEHKAKSQDTILLIEHKLDDLIHLIDRVIVLGAEGVILADGPPREVFERHYALLREHGVWMPQVALLAHHLRERGMAVEPFPLTIEEAALALHGHLAAQQNHPVASNDTATPASAHPLSLSAPPVIEVRHLSFRYGMHQALDDVSLCVPQGDFLAIVGANGAGKTTLAQHFIDILHPPKNTVFLNGQDVTRISAGELIRQVGYVFQNPEHQFVTASVADEIRFGLRRLGLSDQDVDERANAMLERFKLARYARANPFTLSHGEKRRLSVATMLAMGQAALILDEPTFGQDQRNAEALLALLDALHQEGRTVIVITHDMALVAEYARHVVVMAGGRILFHGETQAAFAQPELLAQARLTLPPLARLARRLGRAALTMADFLDLCNPSTLKSTLSCIA